jgi:hypothetical protein
VNDMANVHVMYASVCNMRVVICQLAGAKVLSIYCITICVSIYLCNLIARYCSFWRSWMTCKLVGSNNME